MDDLKNIGEGEEGVVDMEGGKEIWGKKRKKYIFNLHFLEFIFLEGFILPPRKVRYLLLFSEVLFNLFFKDFSKIFDKKYIFIFPVRVDIIEGFLNKRFY